MDKYSLDKCQKVKNESVACHAGGGHKAGSAPYVAHTSAAKQLLHDRSRRQEETIFVSHAIPGGMSDKFIRVRVYHFIQLGVQASSLLKQRRDVCSGNTENILQC